ncbi:MAG TPA: hypothetical protein VNH40_14960, partial [Gaiellaceae bacterium]|nr:hypothetical protein [Gaiellaceae bacterium]
MRTRASARRLLVVAAIAVVMTPWIVVVLVLANPTPPAADRLDRPTAIAWGGRVFSDQPSLTAWLRARGASYGAWAALHPYDAAIVEGTAIP